MPETLSQEAIECGHCGKTSRMRLIVAGNDTIEEEESLNGISRTYEVGTMYEVCVCPHCKMPTLTWGGWHEGMHDPGDWHPTRQLPDAKTRIAHRILDQHTADREFMQLAVQEARQSKSEPAKISPLVGAVVAYEGKKLASGHRGQDKSGEHAEFTVLEGRCRDVTLRGATVYTTLEPCTTRNHPKIPCVTHLIRRKVARVVIGMLDPDERIRGKGVLALRKANIQVDLFPPDLMAELEELNRIFINEKESPGTESVRGPKSEVVGTGFGGKMSLAEPPPPVAHGANDPMTRFSLPGTTRSIKIDKSTVHGDVTAGNKTTGSSVRSQGKKK